MLVVHGRNGSTYIGCLTSGRNKIIQTQSLRFPITVILLVRLSLSSPCYVVIEYLDSMDTSETILLSSFLASYLTESSPLFYHSTAKNKGKKQG